jgi:NH3-dependent NAD+ synthetase
MPIARTSEHDGRRAVVLLSGGLDSTTAMAVARADGYACYALTIDYGQRHRVELDVALPQGRHPVEMTDIPVTYVPRVTPSSSRWRWRGRRRRAPRTSSSA